MENLFRILCYKKMNDKWNTPHNLTCCCNLVLSHHPSVEKDNMTFMIYQTLSVAIVIVFF